MKKNFLLLSCFLALATQEVSAAIPQAIPIPRPSIPTPTLSTTIPGSTKQVTAIGKGKVVINTGLISSKGAVGFGAGSGGTSINKGQVTNDGTDGMFATGLGSKVINDRGGIVNNTLGPRLSARNGGVVENKGQLPNIKMKQVGIFLDHGAISKNSGQIILSGNGGVGVMSAGTSFINTGLILAPNNTAIQMSGNSALELGAGSSIMGNIIGNTGIHSLVLSGNGNISYSQGSLQGFESIVATGDVTLKGGIYNIGVAKDTGYKSDISSPIKHPFNDASFAPGNLTIDSTVNIGVDYSGITKVGTNKTGKIIAKTITKGANGHINITEDSSFKGSNIITELMKNDPSATITSVNGIATTSGAQVVDPQLFTPKNGLKPPVGWVANTVASTPTSNGSLIISEQYKRLPGFHSPAPSAPTPSAPVQVAIGYYGPAPSFSNVAPPLPVLPTKVYPAPSKILIPRNRVDLDSLERLEDLTRNIIDLDQQKLEVGEDKFNLDYLGLKDRKNFFGKESYNYDYKTKTHGMGMSYLYQLSTHSAFGIAGSYEKNKVTYEGVKVNGQQINAPEKNHREDIKSFNGRLFTNFDYGSFRVGINSGYGYSEHRLSTNFISGFKYGRYDSQLFSGGVDTSYLFKVGNLFDIIPYVGIDYIYLSEGNLKYNDNLKFKSSNGDGFSGITKLKIRRAIGKFRWGIYGGYKYNTVDTFQNKRETNDKGLEIASIEYGRGTVLAGANLEFDLNDSLTLRGGYGYEHNKNFTNNTINLGVTFRFNVHDKYFKEFQKKEN